MKKLLACLLLLTAAGCVTPPPTNQANSNAPSATPSAGGAAADVPYSLALEGFAVEGFPGLHSAVVAGPPEKLVVFGGRRNGLHAFPEGREAAKNPAFPKTEANDTVYVLDLQSRKLLGSAQVNSLPAKVANQFKATNTQYELLDGWLYVVGGYGPDARTGALSTLAYVTAVNFDALAAAVVNKTPLDAAFASANVAQFDHPALAITGGELDLLPDASGATSFVLAFGQQYDGEYTPGGGLVNQNYSNGVRVFRFEFAGGGGKPTKLNFVAAVPDPAAGQIDPESPYHRRDFTMKPSLDASGKRRLAAYGGVFKGGRMEGFVNPVFISAGDPAVVLTPNATTVQLLSQYDTAAVQLFDSRAGQGTVYTTFFGGISQYYWDDASKSLKRDALDLSKGIDGLPFINSVSTLKTPTGTDAGSQYLHAGQTFPPAGAVPSCASSAGAVAAPYGGTEAKFVIASGVPQATPGVLQLSAVTAPTVVGYIVGGIASTVPYSFNGATCASATFYRVTLNPAQPTATVLLQAPPAR
jgi:hypothetical protein